MKASTVLRRYTELPYLIDYLATGELFLPDPKSWDDRNDSFYLERYAELSGIDKTFALCLTEAPETYHHWKVFSSGASGVCIVFDKTKFLNAVNQIPALKAQPVKYKKMTDMRKASISKEDLPFIKRYPYRDEREFRLFIAPSRPVKTGFRIAVPKTAISEIVLSPWLAKTVSDHTKSLLNKIKGRSGIKVFRSTLVDNGEWKSFGHKVK